MAEQNIMERDPVCGMQVDPAAARAKSEYGGRTYFSAARDARRNLKRHQSNI